MRTSSLLLASGLSAFATATSYANITAATFYSMVPACILPCNMKALEMDGCDVDDFACHCASPEKIGRNIAPCLFGEAHCSTSDLAGLTQVVNAVCSYEASVNSTVSWMNVSSSGFMGPPGNHTGGGSWAGATPTGPQVAVYAGSANTMKSAGAGLVAIAALAVFAL